MKKCVYAVCALLWASCTASRSASDGSKDREQKETVQIDSLAPNPFIRHMYTADPSAHVWADGRLYVYASHDINPPRGCDLMDQYHVFSTDDMVHWTDHGEILRASQVLGDARRAASCGTGLCLQGRHVLFLFSPS